MSKRITITTRVRNSPKTIIKEEEILTFKPTSEPLPYYDVCLSVYKIDNIYLISCKEEKVRKLMELLDVSYTEGEYVIHRLQVCVWELDLHNYQKLFQSLKLPLIQPIEINEQSVQSPFIYKYNTHLSAVLGNTSKISDELEEYELVYLPITYEDVTTYGWLFPSQDKKLLTQIKKLIRK